MPDLCRRHQQAPYPPLSGRRPLGGLHRTGADGRPLARKLAKTDPVRLNSLVRPEQMPFDNITNKHFDSGDYPESLRRAIEASILPPSVNASAAVKPMDVTSESALQCIRSRARTAPPVYAGWGIPMVPGHKQFFRSSKTRRWTGTAHRCPLPWARPGNHAGPGRHEILGIEVDQVGWSMATPR
ncbi:MAG: hypothetical protein CM1200mP20_00610 [Pseudomonadota bacterium]|nr:MAG: hypothetical protein CM1200mP20_00610 [Pseudomonadota bacterium]